VVVNEFREQRLQRVRFWNHGLVFVPTEFPVLPTGSVF
jgi:hypothetical protein